MSRILSAPVLSLHRTRLVNNDTFWGEGEMASEGFIRSAGICAVLGAAVIFAQPLKAQTELERYIELEREAGRPHPHIIVRDANASGPTAYAPVEIRHGYGFDQIANQGAGEIIGIVDAYDDPNAESDLAVFDKQFQLPSCTTSNGCFRKIYSAGHKPAVNKNWTMETALDIEWAHAIAPHAVILLVEANSNNLNDLFEGVDVAVRQGASVVSMSWTATEFNGENSYDHHFAENGVTFVAAAGDNGTGAAYPASSPDVIGVGGTTLILSVGGAYSTETAWSGSGGGISRFEWEPLFQAELPIPDDGQGLRGAPDVAYGADPAHGYSVYNTVVPSGPGGWFQVGGTSAGTPQWAALFAIANSMRAAARKARLSGTNSVLYGLGKTDLKGNYHSVTTGKNGACGAVCDAQSGYDFITGLGSPNAKALVSALVATR
jgi:subtilase family serine protease